MIRLLVDPEALTSDGELTLTREESHHFTVRRGAPGDPVVLMDGAGGVGQGTVVSTGTAVRVAMQKVQYLPQPGRLTLAVGAGDRDRFTWLVEKAAELAVTDIIPLKTSRSASVASGIKASQLAKLNQRAREAIKQSGSAWAPVVSPMATVNWIAEQPWTGNRWLAHQEGESVFRMESAPELILVVGPEGGLDESEQGLLVDAGFERIELGGHTLRFETAALLGAGIAGLLRAGRPK